MDAKEYGKALFLLSEERGNSDAVLKDLQTVSAVLKGTPSYVGLLDSPAVAGEEKEGLIDEAFASVATDVRSFIKILAGKHALYAFSRCADAYAALYDESRGIERAQAVTAVPMSDAQCKAMTEKLSVMTGKTVILTNVVDPSVLGGVKVRIAGRQLDGSLATRLENVARAVREAIV